MSGSFVHLHLHSEFSLADGLLKVKDIVSRAVAADMPAIALTDIGNLFGLVKFYETCLAAGVKPILGAELKVVAGRGDHAGPRPQAKAQGGDHAAERIVLLAMNQTGYRNLIELVSKSYTGTSVRGVLPEADVFERHEGLLVLSGGVGGHLWSFAANDDDAAMAERARTWAAVFGDRYYLEITRAGRPGEAGFLAKLVTLATELGLGMVATNDVCFLNADDFEATRLACASTRAAR